MQKFLITTSLCILLAGCGYTTQSALPGHLETIHVEKFKNEIDYTIEQRRNVYIPLLEQDVRNAIVDRFLFDGNLRIAETAQSDLILKGALVNFHRGELREEENEDVQEYRIYISVDLALYDTDTGELRWEEKGFTGETTYFVTGPKATSEASAIDEAITDLARRTVERTIEDW